MKAGGLKLIDSRLVSLSARRLMDETPDDAKEIKMSRKSEITVLKQDKEKVRARFSYKVLFKPFGPFEIDLEMDATFLVNGQIPTEALAKELENASTALYADASLAIAFVSDKMVGFPFIMAPFKEHTEDEVTLVKED